MKRLFPVLISITLALSVFNTGLADAGTNSRALTPPTQRASAVRFVPRQIRQGNRRLRYTIKARYPQATGAGRDARLLKLNRELRSLIAKEVADFKTDFAAPEERLSEGSYFDADYTVSFATNDLVSIGFGVSTYFEGAAHPNHNTLVFNYDLSTGKNLSLANLFKPNSNYLSVISGYAVEALKKKLGPDPDAEWIERGAGASDENYQNWNVTRDGLEVTFDAYQVASYAEGPHEVVVPYAILKDVIDPDGPLARIAR